MKLLAPLVLLFATGLLSAAPEYPKSGPDIYDPQADGAAQVAGALKEARSGHKVVLLDLGANWCSWCHALHRLFTTDPAVAAALDRDFVVVMIDVNTRHGVKRNADLNLKYGDPVRLGLPVLVVLDADGRQLTTQDSGELENGKDAHDPAKVLAFLRQWAPKG